MERYARQVILSEIGKNGQKKLLSSSVLIIGAGGLGCPALQYLAGAGIGQIGIIDPDHVSESNLHRQILYNTDDIGQNKAIAAKAHLQKLNPEITITAIPEKLTIANAPALFKTYDIILDGSDNFQTKFVANDAAFIASKPLVYGSVLGFVGQVSVFNTAPDTPCYRCLFPKAPTQNIPNCEEAGVLGAVAGITGTLQALEVIKIVLQNPDLPPLSGKILQLDAKTLRQSLIKLPKNPKCPLCSKQKEEITMPTEIKTITASALKAQSNDITILDVRESDEYAQGHIDGAISLPLSKIAQGARPDFPKDTHVVVNCLGGIRSLQAIEILIPEGYNNLINLDGGYKAWTE